MHSNENICFSFSIFTECRDEFSIGQLGKYAIPNGLLFMHQTFGGITKENT